MKTNVMRILAGEGVAYEVKHHSREAFTAADAAAERGVRVSQIVKTMLLRLGSGDCVAALLPGDRKLDRKLVRQLVEQRSIDFVPRDEVQRISGYVPGAVSPVGLRGVREVILDPAVLDEEFVDISSGRPDVGIELRSVDLVRVIDPRIAVICRATTPPAADGIHE